MNYCTNYCDGKELLQRHPLRNPPLRRTPKVRFQTPNSVSLFALTELRGESSVSSSHPIICVPKRTHRVFCRTHRVCPKTQWGSVSSLLRNSTLETVFRPFPSQLGQKGPFRGSFCFPPQLWGTEEFVPIGRPQSALKRSDCPGKISPWFTLKMWGLSPSLWDPVWIFQTRFLGRRFSGKSWRATTEGQNRFIIFQNFSHFFRIFPQDFPLQNKGL